MLKRLHLADISKFDNFNPIENTNEFNFSLLIKYPCKSTSECHTIEGTILNGVYLFEVWGAQGGTGCYSTAAKKEGANGGYAAALFRIQKNSKIFLNIGGKGGDAVNMDFKVSEGGFNGGGKGGFDKDLEFGIGGGGGGSTDIRLNNNELESRIIVAGGAGGSQYNQKGGVGGGETGEDGNSTGYAIAGKKGTQSGPGISEKNRGATSGSLGKGGDGSGVSTQYSSNGGSGGGSGYYGGSGGEATKDHFQGRAGSGGGGSGYISKSSITYMNSTQSSIT